MPIDKEDQWRTLWIVRNFPNLDQISRLVRSSQHPNLPETNPDDTQTFADDFFLIIQFFFENLIINQSPYLWTYKYSIFNFCLAEFGNFSYIQRYKNPLPSLGIALVQGVRHYVMCLDLVVINAFCLSHTKITIRYMIRWFGPNHWYTKWHMPGFLFIAT